MNTLDCPRCLNRLPQAWRYEVGNQAADQLGHAMYYVHGDTPTWLRWSLAPDGQHATYYAHGGTIALCHADLTPPPAATSRPRIRLTNDFHRTEAVVIPQPVTAGRFRGRHYISRKTVLRLRRELCGMPTCKCGGTFGERGGRWFEIVTEDYNRNVIVEVAE